MSLNKTLIKRNFARSLRSLKDTFHPKDPPFNPFKPSAEFISRLEKFEETRYKDFPEFIDNVHELEIYL